MFVSFIVRSVSTAIALWVADKLISGIQIDGSWFAYLSIAVFFGLVNGVVGNVVRFFSLPLIVLTLGLFLLIVNAAMLALTAALVSTFTIDNFGSAFLGSLIISIVGAPTALLIKSAIGKK